MTLGGLSKEDHERIGTGTFGDPTVGRVVALAVVFGAEPSYLLNRGEPVFDGESLRPCGTRRSGRQPARSRA